MPTLVSLSYASTLPDPAGVDVQRRGSDWGKRGFGKLAAAASAAVKLAWAARKIDRLRVLLNRTSEQHMIGQKQIESALGHPIDHAFASDYGTVSAALNSGVPLTLSNHSELSAQFSQFTSAILNRKVDVAEPVGARRKSAFLGLF